MQARPQKITYLEEAHLQMLAKDMVFWVDYSVDIDTHPLHLYNLLQNLREATPHQHRETDYPLAVSMEESLNLRRWTQLIPTGEPHGEMI